ncbi:MAG: hypothetical protein R3324_13030, partial [Halobacteriales archaeon]|nr:hypothetical protein [Halobacteriales archaeon]
ARTDLYALGCLAWELIHGEPPFVGTVDEVLRAQVYEEPQPAPRQFATPDGLERWLDGMLAKRPEDRFASAADAARALVRLGEPGHGLTPIDPAVIPPLPGRDPPIFDRAPERSRPSGPTHRDIRGSVRRSVPPRSSRLKSN